MEIFMAKKNSKYLRGNEIDIQLEFLPKRNKKKTPNFGMGQLQLKHLNPLTENQNLVFEHYNKGKNIVCCGSSGSGKSLVLMYLMLNDLLSDDLYEKIVVYRTACQVRSMGFTPGSEREKINVYSNGIRGICNELFGRGDSYEILERKELVEFTSTSFARSITHNNTLVLFEEAQNATFNEIAMVATRIGNNSKLFLTGDTAQMDLGKNEKSGFYDFIRVAKEMESMAVVQFTIDDIVRSSFVKEFLVAKETLGIE